MKDKMFYLIVGIILMLVATDVNSQQISKEEYAKRRKEFMEKMEGGIAIFISPEVANRNNDIDYKYRQNSDFYYLTGFEEPNSMIVLSPGEEHEFVMFVEESNPMFEMWTGKKAGTKGAMDKFGADTAYSIRSFNSMFFRLLRGKDALYYNLSNEDFNKRYAEYMSKGWGRLPDKIISPSGIVHTMRLFKSEEEIKVIQKAVDVTAQAHIEAQKNCKPEMFEYEIKALIEYTFEKNKCPRAGFPSIVGSGINATVLHYEGSERKMEDGDLLLMDIGAEYDFYSADITRTIPVNGEFSKAQKELYESVLAFQEKGISMIKTGVGIKSIEKAMTDMAIDKLFDLGLITNKEADWQWRLWYFPYTCHWMGLDVHDVEGKPERDNGDVILKPGMITTVEPGLYINPSCLSKIRELSRMSGSNPSDEEISEFVKNVESVVERYANIGIRIEDDVLVTNDGNRVLSAKAPKTVKEIEEMMN